MVRKTKSQKILCGLLLILLAYIMLLLIPYPLIDIDYRDLSNFDTLSWLSRSAADDDKRYKEIKTSDIRKYCVEKLGVPYNYTADKFRDEVPNHYYAGLTYLAKHLYINDDYKFIYLSVPKVACSNWKRLLLQLKNVTDEKKLSWPHNNGDHKRLVNLPRSEWRSVLQDYGYYKFAFVRNPWTRLVSAYVDRFTRHDEWWYGYIQQTEGRRMIKNHRPGASQLEITEAHDVRFDEFVKDILEHQRDSPSKNTATNLNEHWNPEFFIAGLCHPWIEYDFIGRYEELDTASLEVFRRIHLPNPISSFPKPSRNSSTMTRAALEYSLLDSKLLANLSRQLLPDMELLGYEVPPELSHVVPDPRVNNTFCNKVPDTD